MSEHRYSTLFVVVIGGAMGLCALAVVAGGIYTGLTTLLGWL